MGTIGFVGRVCDFLHRYLSTALEHTLKCLNLAWVRDTIWTKRTDFHCLWLHCKNKIFMRWVLKTSSTFRKFSPEWEQGRHSVELLKGTCCVPFKSRRRNFESDIIAHFKTEALFPWPSVATAKLQAHKFSSVIVFPSWGITFWFLQENISLWNELTLMPQRIYGTAWSLFSPMGSDSHLFLTEISRKRPVTKCNRYSLFVRT